MIVRVRPITEAWRGAALYDGKSIGSQQAAPGNGSK